MESINCTFWTCSFIAGDFIYLSFDEESIPEWERPKESEAPRDMDQEVDKWVEAIHTVASFNQDRFSLSLASRNIPK